MWNASWYPSVILQQQLCSLLLLLIIMHRLSHSLEGETGEAHWLTPLTLQLWKECSKSGHKWKWMQCSTNPCLCSNKTSLAVGSLINTCIGTGTTEWFKSEQRAVAGLWIVLHTLQTEIQFISYFHKNHSSNYPYRMYLTIYKALWKLYGWMIKWSINTV